MLALRAVRWWRDLARLGVNLPLFAAHDLGLLYAAPRDRLDLTPRTGAEGAPAGPKLQELSAAYRSLILEVAESQAASTARGMKLADDLIVVVLARVLSALVRDTVPPPPWPATLPLDPELVRDLEPQLPALFAASPRSYEAEFLSVLAGSRLRVLTLVD